LTQLEAGTPGQIIVGAADTGVLTDTAMTGDVTMANTGVTTLNAAHQEQILHVAVEDLGVGADIAGRSIYVHPRANTLQSIGILTQDAPAGVDNDNTVVITLTDDADNVIVTKTYNEASQPPSSDYADLGALDGTHKALAATEHVKLTVTQGGTADMPAFQLVFVTVPTNAA